MTNFSERIRRCFSENNSNDYVVVLESHLTRTDLLTITTTKRFDEQLENWKKQPKVTVASKKVTEDGYFEPKVLNGPATESECGKWLDSNRDKINKELNEAKDKIRSEAENYMSEYYRKRRESIKGPSSQADSLKKDSKTKKPKAKRVKSNSPVKKLIDDFVLMENDADSDSDLSPEDLEAMSPEWKSVYQDYTVILDSESSEEADPEVAENILNKIHDQASLKNIENGDGEVGYLGIGKFGSFDIAITDEFGMRTLYCKKDQAKKFRKYLASIGDSLLK